MIRQLRTKYNESTIGKLWYILTSDNKKKLVFVSIIIFVSALVNVFGIFSIMPFMKVLANPNIVKDNEILGKIYYYLGSPDMHLFIIVLGIGVLFIFIISNIFMAITIYAQYHFVQDVAYHLTSKLMSGYLKQPYEYFLNRNISELSKNIFSEVNQVISSVVIALMNIVSKAILSIVIIIFLIIIEPKVAIATLIILGGSYLTVFRVVKQRLSKLGEKRVHANKERFRIASEVFGGIKQVKLSSREDDYINRFNPHIHSFERTRAKTQVISKLPKYLMEIIAFGGVLSVVLILFAINQTIDEVLPIISLYLFAGYRLMPAMQDIFSSFSKVRSSAASVDILYKDIDGLSWSEEEAVFDYTNYKLKKINFQKSIELKRIKYKYPNSIYNVINKVNLKIDKNTTIGFVGSTGCGKTTLIDILLCLLCPQSGKYFVDGVLIQKQNIRSWRNHLGYVPQDIFLADDTVTRNVAFGVPKDEIDFNAVKRASNIANIDVFIRDELANGYETVVGERGIRLSGGQKQRIGIARALYHNPEVLILDEATSALDGKTEMAIMDAIHKLSRKKTIIMIAHRLTTLRECDIIYVLEKGQIVDSGNFHDLKMRNMAFKHE